MTPKGKKILIISLVSVGVAIAIITPFAIVSLRKRNNQEEVDSLLNLAQQENKLSKNQSDRLRFLYSINKYQLPAAYQAAWNKYLPNMQAALKDFKEGRLSSAKNRIMQISNSIDPSVKPDFEAAYKLFIDMIVALQSVNNKAQHNEWLIKSAQLGHKVNNFFKTSWLAPPLMLVGYINTFIGVDHLLKETAAMGYNPIYLLNRALIFDKKYSLNTLKIFDMMWQLAKGENYFTINANSVSLQ